MTRKLAYIEERDGKTFIVDGEGRELAQCVPKTLTGAQRMALEPAQ